MNGYSKIKLGNSTKSRSVDFSDLFPSPQTPKISINPKPQQIEQAKNKITPEENEEDSADDAHVDDGVGERSDVVLSRNFSTKSQRFFNRSAEKQNTALQSAVKRAFSMRRSSSVSEGGYYCRIYESQCESDPPLSSLPVIDGNEDMKSRSNSKRKMRGKILKACKRLLGL